MSWHVLYLRPRWEKKMSEYCQILGLKFYLPLRTETKVYQRRKVTVEKPVFPSYFFASFGQEGRLGLLKTNSIVRILTPHRERQLLHQLAQVRKALSVDASLGACTALRRGRRVRIVATGRSDFANQVNNSLGFPGIFRGLLDVRARTISDEMAIAAACEIARCAEEKGLHEEYIVPTMDEWDVFPREAVATAMKAQEQGLARLHKSPETLYEQAKATIQGARTMLETMMAGGLIAPMPE